VSATAHGDLARLARPCRGEGRELGGGHQSAGISRLYNTRQWIGGRGRNKRFEFTRLPPRSKTSLLAVSNRPNSVHLMRNDGKLLFLRGHSGTFGDIRRLAGPLTSPGTLSKTIIFRHPRSNSPTAGHAGSAEIARAISSGIAEGTSCKALIENVDAWALEMSTL